ncbi:hypothetical protein [Dyella mobilis]|uniref:Uncharacterized protein n=1 Tax=Dyella mobilis TaxID=1849582 RepID=A0ABS2KBD9_9GAMM|nr:hypothetical protein [Dyella mobilis]MBM7128497.1 hypothetical protein [Dyella mobilis]GLQ99602.1 hypothetical protein GCM10007863_40220 [Dyella mobilis]
MSISTNVNQSNNTNFNQMYSDSLANGQSKEKLNQAKAALGGGQATYESLIAAMGELADKRLQDAQISIQQLEQGESSGGGDSTGGGGGGSKPSETMKATTEVQLAMGDIQAAQKTAESAAQEKKQQEGAQ